MSDKDLSAYTDEELEAIASGGKQERDISDYSDAELEEIVRSYPVNDSGKRIPTMGPADTGLSDYPHREFSPAAATVRGAANMIPLAESITAGVKAIPGMGNQPGNTYSERLTREKHELEREAEEAHRQQPTPYNIGRVGGVLSPAAYLKTLKTAMASMGAMGAVDEAVSANPGERGEAAIGGGIKGTLAARFGHMFGEWAGKYGSEKASQMLDAMASKLRTSGNAAQIEALVQGARKLGARRPVSSVEENELVNIGANAEDLGILPGMNPLTWAKGRRRMTDEAQQMAISEGPEVKAKLSPILEKLRRPEEKLVSDRTRGAVTAFLGALGYPIFGIGAAAPAAATYAAIPAINATGRNAMRAGLKLSAETQAKLAEIVERYTPQLEAAVQEGPKKVAVINYALSKQYPEWAEMLQQLKEYSPVDVAE